MSYEAESRRLGDEYRIALNRAQDSEAFWSQHPIVAAIAPGETPRRTDADVLIEAVAIGTPNSAWSAAMAKLGHWRSYRAAHGHA